MISKDLFLVELINKHYSELMDEFRTFNSFEEFESACNSLGLINKAICFDLIQIDENVNKLSSDSLSQIKSSDISGLVGTRNAIVHGYGTIDVRKLWQTIKNDLPELIKQINNIR